MVHKPTAERCYELTGIGHRYTNRNDGGRLQHGWRVYRAEHLAWIASEILPYSVTKQVELRILLTFLQTQDIDHKIALCNQLRVEKLREYPD